MSSNGKQGSYDPDDVSTPRVQWNEVDGYRRLARIERNTEEQAKLLFGLSRLVLAFGTISVIVDLVRLFWWLGER